MATAVFERKKNVAVSRKDAKDMWKTVAIYYA